MNDEEKAKKSRKEYLKGLSDRGELAVFTKCPKCGSLQAIMYKGTIVCGACLKTN